MTRAASSLRPRGPVGVLLAVCVLMAGLFAVAGSQSSNAAGAPTATAAASAAAPASSGKPTIVLVHGAFADASGWSGVISRLQVRGYTVYAPPNTLRGVSADAAYLKTFLDTISGPIVLVGHSYGGVAITNAAKDNANVTALVYIAAFAPAEGESVEQASALGGGSNDLIENIDFRPFGAGPTDLDATIKVAEFRRLFAQDLPKRQTDVMAVSQRPAALLTLVEPSGPPAWADIESWYLVAKNDNTIPPAAERFMAERAGAHTIEIRSSHVAMMSHPAVVTGLILKAAR